MMHSPIWQDPYYLKVWMYCLMKASHKEHEQLVGSQMITLNPGEFVTGRQSLAEDLNKGMKPNQKLSEKTWYRYIENLEKWKMLTIKKTNKYSVISIVKWNDYQESDQQLSNKSPSVDQQLSTNKNVKNVKNDKKNNIRSKLKFETHHLKLAQLLFKEIRKNNESAKEPNLEDWANTFRLMMERDKRAGKDIQNVIMFCQKHEFWSMNILSANKLRKQFDRLCMEMSKDNRNKSPNNNRKVADF